MHDPIAVLVGTRPGIIKMTPIVHELASRGAPHFVIHSGQHYSERMDAVIMSDVGLPPPKHRILRPPNCVSHAQQTAYMLTRIEEALLAERPAMLLVCGDANTNLAGALAARKIHTAVGHVEAGLRSRDWRMPEEHNRVIIDHISEYLFAPTPSAKTNLERDGVSGKVFVVGNTIVDATLAARDKALKHPAAVRLAQAMSPYVLVTTHREENVDDPPTLTAIVRAIVILATEGQFNFVLPLHPRTAVRLAGSGLDRLLKDTANIHVVEPLGYHEFIGALAGADLVMTDSGGVQEESCILGVPCVTLRQSTERQETVAIGANLIAGTTVPGILEAFRVALQFRGREPWVNPYGDGLASRRIVDVCLVGAPATEWSTPVAGQH